MVLVSHDRYLLSSVCDEFYLVDAGAVTVFNGDLDDYKKWLFSSTKASANIGSIRTGDMPSVVQSSNILSDANASISSENTGAEVDKKTRKRLEAEFRQSTKSFRDAIIKQEKRMETCNQQLAKLEIELSDTSLYEADNKKRLTQVLTMQADNKIALEEAELFWLDAQEELETASAKFENSIQA
jgi:ATP-binding cassette subfamily F protein 3